MWLIYFYKCRHFCVPFLRFWIHSDPTWWLRTRIGQCSEFVFLKLSVMNLASIMLLALDFISYLLHEWADIHRIQVLCYRKAREISVEARWGSWSYCGGRLSYATLRDSGVMIIPLSAGWIPPFLAKFLCSSCWARPPCKIVSSSHFHVSWGYVWERCPWTLRISGLSNFLWLPTCLLWLKVLQIVMFCFPGNIDWISKFGRCGKSHSECEG